MCNCKNIDIGSYDNQVELKAWWNEKIICIDECLWKEIQSLLNNKIQTAGCCCGHNKNIPMINVIDEHHEKMVKLGYAWHTNQHGTKWYEPKSLVFNNFESYQTK